MAHIPTVDNHKLKDMKTKNFFPTYFGLILIMNFGCMNDSEDKKVKELESIIMQTGVMYGEMELHKINSSRTHAITLFEDIDNIELLIPETYKVISILYLNSGKSNKALMPIDRYIDKFPNDGEALFFKGLILKQKNMEFCDYFERSEELGFEINNEVRFTWNLDVDTCL